MITNCNKIVTVFLLAFLNSRLVFAGYKGEFFLAGLSYGAAIFMTMQSDNKQHDHHSEKEMYRITDKKSKDFAELSGMWDHLAREEYTKNGDSNLYRHYVSERFVDTESSEKFKMASLDYAKNRDSADEEREKWKIGSFVAFSVGTVCLMKGIISYMRRDSKKKRQNIELKPYHDALGLRLAYSF